MKWIWSAYVVQGGVVWYGIICYCTIVWKNGEWNGSGTWRCIELSWVYGSGGCICCWCGDSRLIGRGCDGWKWWPLENGDEECWKDGAVRGWLVQEGEVWLVDGKEHVLLFNKSRWQWVCIFFLNAFAMLSRDMVDVLWLLFSQYKE